MRKGEDVFLLTLVDLLLQFLFLGLVAYAANAVVGSPQSNPDAAGADRLDSLAKAQGFANLAELTDVLTRLAPVRQLQRSDSLVRIAGGIDSFAHVVANLRRGSGAPPCIFRRGKAREDPIPVALITAWDDSLLIEPAGTDTLASLLRSAGAQALPEGKIALGDFRSRFSLIARRDCRYQVRFDERTEYVRARDTVLTVFAITRVRP